MTDKPRILIVGGGYVGLYTALRLERRTAPDDAELTMVNPESFMVYQPFLAEAAGGHIHPRHAVVPIRGVLKRTRLITGRVTDIDHRQRSARVAPTAGDPYELSYDHVVVAPGSVTRVLSVPGLEERAIGFTSVSEAIYLRNRVLARMDAAESTADTEVRRRALSFLFVGAGYAGIEALAELEAQARDACKLYRTIRREDMRWTLVEARNEILPEIGARLAAHSLRVLRARGIHIHLGTRLLSAEDGVMRLSNGLQFEADTLVWTAGVKANPLVARIGMPTDERGRLETDEYLQVRRVDNAWSAGDCAAVPDVTSGRISPQNAQFAMRQARVLADNLAARLEGGTPKGFRHKSLGGIASLARHDGVAKVLGLDVWGLSAWLLHRGYHISKIPTVGRKARILADWAVNAVLRRDLVQLGSLGSPRDPFEQALDDYQPLT